MRLERYMQYPSLNQRSSRARKKHPVGCFFGGDAKALIFDQIDSIAVSIIASHNPQIVLKPRQNVEQRKQHNPNNVNEVPINLGHLYASVVRVGVVP